MDQELKAYLDALKTGIQQDLAGLKADITGLKADMGTLRADIRQEMGEMKRELREHTETVETRLLTEFWKWAKTADARYRQNQAVVGAMDDRVGAVEDRVSELERRRAS